MYVAESTRTTLWWQGLAYLLLTLAEILISVTGLEMAFVVAPARMKGFVTSLWLLTVFLANFAALRERGLFHAKSPSTQSKKSKIGTPNAESWIKTSGIIPIAA